MASAAFETKFIIVFERWTGDPIIFKSSESSCDSICTRDWKDFNFSNSGLEKYSDIISFKFITSETDTPLLASVNKSCTIAAAFIPDCCIVIMEFLIGLSSGRSIRINSG